ncbi:hypothetical protein [Candidatus Contubernalis alkaliaceticus]|uniref:hypothetical protein n=1 Tax=Candidatus Contubernalis alkaliaceticus TaxID=338645 RepID=UPI001F4C3E3F|nr:hypothetical protein [Candidatus Contubernalis alkalaceticus]UNC91691.1 hypothetical protein HUE98_06045 [Candidatus Contubernalis alkalaceticus]
MKAIVTKEFRDKYTKVLYIPGDIYEHQDEKRIKFLQEAKALGDTLAEDPPPSPKGDSAEPINLGGGWYQLPDGRKVRKSEIDGGEG